MVTLITEKLQDQTLEEITTKERIHEERMKKSMSLYDVTGKSSRPSRLNHSRTKSKDNSSNRAQEVGKLRTLPFHGTRCQSYPPARKRLCRSLSNTDANFESVSGWRPEPSSIWTPVKSRKTDTYYKPSGVRCLEYTCGETFFNSWSTPPESPISRPVSANSSMDDSKFFPLRLISDEKHNNEIDKVFTDASQECHKMSPTMPRRSQSHPSFTLNMNSGLKRRLSEIDIPRPALDFNKMKARTFLSVNCDRKNLKCFKHVDKRNVSLKENHATEQKKMMFTNYASEDLGVSLLITPTASPITSSPTTEMKTSQTIDCNILSEDDNSNRKLMELFSPNNNSMVDVELDVALIEEDGTNANPAQSTMLFI